jgi:hypothetical protein
MFSEVMVVQLPGTVISLFLSLCLPLCLFSHLSHLSNDRHWPFLF